MDPKGQVPLMVVFESLPTFPIFSKDIPGYENQMKALRTARNKVTNVRAEKAIRRAIKPNTPPAVYYNLNSSDKVYAYSNVLAEFESLFKTLVKYSTTAEQRLMIDNTAAREAFDWKEITTIDWVRSESSVADKLTKSGKFK